MHDMKRQETRREGHQLSHTRPGPKVEKWKEPYDTIWYERRV